MLCANFSAFTIKPTIFPKICCRITPLSLKIILNGDNFVYFVFYYCLSNLKIFFTKGKKFFFRYYLSSAICVFVYVCVCVFAITATPFNLELSNFGITFLMWICKNGFLKFLKNCFFPELLPFFYFSLRFLCKFEELLRKINWR